MHVTARAIGVGFHIHNEEREAIVAWDGSCTLIGVLRMSVGLRHSPILTRDWK